MTTNILVILAGAFLTYLTRAGGHMVLSRFERVHLRFHREREPLVVIE